MATFPTPLGDICFEQRGSRANPTVLMIHGVSCQLVHWPDSLLDGIVDAGYRVVVFDNRDAGLSFDYDAPAPAIPDLLAALDNPSLIESSYSLSDMADDAVSLLDHLGQSAAHVVGMSMGGMIAQRMAINHTNRVFSVASIMSSTGNPELTKPAPEISAALAAVTFLTERSQVIQATRNNNRMFGGEHYDSCEVGIGRFVERAYDRAQRPEGFLRQLAAILTDGDRGPALRDVTLPFLAIHGEVDPLVNKDGSEDLVANAPNSSLHLLPKVGHDLPEPVIPQILDLLLAHLQASDAKR